MSKVLNNRITKIKIPTVNLRLFAKLAGRHHLYLAAGGSLLVLFAGVLVFYFYAYSTVNSSYDANISIKKINTKLYQEGLGFIKQENAGITISNWNPFAP